MFVKRIKAFKYGEDIPADATFIYAAYERDDWGDVTINTRIFNLFFYYEVIGQKIEGEDPGNQQRA